ncbi:hypothetical protein JRO89_XS08G0235500 [Xanthoceras sorbifolium]|uniref:oligopeptidase A n=1 Tax=Xanthoceras sorbifolium TaxID=99658 RepID=A0ABQ8HR20_9ROSI|nr:hypothetical protein JRO89_XS08G0235500 [Xanthoceras sorbifolium]
MLQTTFNFSSSSSSTLSMAAIDELSLEANPLLQDFEFPPFDVVEAKHVRPGIRALLNILENELDQLEKTVEPSWPKLVEPLEKIIDRLSVVWGMINHLKAVKDTPELRSAIEEVQPERVKFSLRLGQSKPIYNAFKAIRESPDWHSLSEARKRVVELHIRDSVLTGVSLEDDKRDQFNKIEQEQTKLSKKFDENVLDATKKFEKVVIEKTEIEGLPATALGLAAQKALSKGHENATAENGPWMITLDAPSYNSVMRHARNRALREEVYRAYVTRASSGDMDNTPIIEQILKLRLQNAELLAWQPKWTVDKAVELLEKLCSASWNHAIEDMEDLKIFSKGQGAIEADDLRPWDINFWSERLRESKYDINEFGSRMAWNTDALPVVGEDLRPYFSLPKVMDGLFNLAKILFGIDIEPADGLAPVWNTDVRFYRVKDSSGSPIAYFYFDPYSRPSEKSKVTYCQHGVQSNTTSRGQAKPYDFSRAKLGMCSSSSSFLAAKVQPCDVETVFHEFGHALQHMLTKQDESLVAGTRRIEWDAVELPSQFMGNWCYHRDTLMSLAKHYKTGESLPEDIFEAGFCEEFPCWLPYSSSGWWNTLVRFGTVDLELHIKYVPGGSESIHDVSQRIAKRGEVIPLLPDDRFLCSFNHIFAGGYAAGYYSYQWAKVLSADAFSAFEDAGLDDRKVVSIVLKTGIRAMPRSGVLRMLHVRRVPEHGGEELTWIEQALEASGAPCKACALNAVEWRILVDREWTDGLIAVKDTGLRFRETILALGGGKPALEVFVDFRGREPSPEALLRQYGLLAVPTLNVGIAVQADWENREFISHISLNVRRLFEFLVHFEATTKSKLASLNEKLDTLERRLELLEFQVGTASANPHLFTT